jgi:hypothetical protein
VNALGSFKQKDDIQMRLTKSMITLALAASLSVSAVSAQDTPVNVDIGLKALLEDGASIDGLFENGTTAHLYGFYGSAGDVVTISMDATSDALDPFIALIGPNGESISHDDDITEGEGDDESITSFNSLIEDVELPVDGPYLIVATSYDYMTTVPDDEENDAEDGETYTLTVEGPTTPEITEDTVVVGTAVEQGAEVEGELTWENPVSVFFYNGKAGDEITVSMSSEETDPIIHIFDPVGDRVAVNDDIDRDNGDFNSQVESLELTQDGTYVILATNYAFFNAWEGENGENVFFVEGAYKFTIE